MFGHFQTRLNKLRSLGKTYDNYDHIDKILRSLSRKWRPHVTALRALKTLDTMSLEEPVGTLKVHEQELQQDEGIKKGKSLALSAQKAKKAPSSEESSSRPLSKSVSKALSMENSSEEEFDEDDELAFISTKIRKMCKNKSGSRLKKSSKKVFREKKDKEKSFIIY